MAYDEVPLQEVLRPQRHVEDVSPDRRYRIAGIYSFGKGMLDRGFREGSEISYRTLTRLNEGQVVFARLNAWEGALAVVSDDFDGTYVSSEYPTFEIDSKVVEHAYVRYLLGWSRLWTRLTPRGSMVRRKRTTESVFLATKIPLPDLGEQRRIIAKLDRVFGSLAPAVERSKDAESTLYNSLLFELYSDRFPVAKLGQVLRPGGEIVHVEPSSQYRTAGIRSFGNGIFERPVIRGVETNYSNLWCIRSGQLIYSKLFAWEGAVAVANGHHDGLHFSGEFPIFDIDDSKLLPAFAKYLVRCPALHEQLQGGTTGVGNRRQRVNIDRFLDVSVPLPKIDDQYHIVVNLNIAFMNLGKLLSRRNQLEEALRSAMLNAAFSGQL